MLDFIERQVAADTPFFVTYWPLMLQFFQDPEKKTLQWGLIAEGLRRLDEFIGTLMDKLRELGIADNTLLVCHADNGPMTHDPPAGMGLAETIFRGGKGDYTEGGLRVPAFAWWPGVIEGGQIVNDIVHETDLFGLTNARPETLAIAEHLESLRADLPFDPFEFMDWEPPTGIQKVNMID